MKKCLFFFLFVFSIIKTFSQIDYYENPKNYKDSIRISPKLNYGGDFSFWFGSNTYLYLNGVVAKPLTKWNSIGTGIDFIWYKNIGYKSQFIYGTGFFDEFYLLNFFVIHSGVKLFNVIDYVKNERVLNPEYYIGGGIRQNIGKKSYVTYLILWNLNQNEYSLFNNPIMRFTLYF